MCVMKYLLALGLHCSALVILLRLEGGIKRYPDNFGSRGMRNHLFSPPGFLVILNQSMLDALVLNRREGSMFLASMEERLDPALEHRYIHMSQDSRWAGGPEVEESPLRMDWTAHQ